MRFLIVVSLIGLLSLNAIAKKKGAPPMAAGAPGDRTCQTSKCHAGNDLNTDKASIVIEGIPEAYKANEIYEITLHLKQAGAKKWGFEATVADEKGKAAGTLISLEGQNTQILSNAKYKSRTNRQYITHTKSGIKGPKKGVSPTWKMQWQAPDSASVSPSFYFTFNAANGNTKKTGDYIYSRSIKVNAVTE